MDGKDRAATEMITDRDNKDQMQQRGTVLGRGRDSGSDDRLFRSIVVPAAIVMVISLVGIAYFLMTSDMRLPKTAKQQSTDTFTEAEKAETSGDGLQSADR